jgi:amino acid transporter
MAIWQKNLLSTVMGVIVIALLYRQINSVARITIWLWVGTLLTAGVVIVAGAFHFDPKLAFDFPPGAFRFSLGFVLGLGAASRFGIYDYLGSLAVGVAREKLLLDQ